MANQYWVGADSSWNTAANWASSSGGSDATGPPGSGDDVIFDGGDVTNCTLDVDAQTIASLTITSGYSGTLDFADSSYSMTISGDFTCDGTGTVDLGNASISCGGNLDCDTQTTWTVGTSTVTLAGTTKTFNGRAAGLKTFYSLIVSGDYTVSVSNVGAENATINGTMRINNLQWFRVIGGDGVVGASGLVTNVSGLGRFTVWENGTIENSAGGTIETGVMIRGNGGTSQIKGSSTFDGDLILDSLFSSGDQTVTFGSASSQTITCNGDLKVESRVAYDTNVDMSTYNPDLIVQGDITVLETSGTVTWSKGTGTINLTGGNDQSVDFDDETVEDISVDKSAGTLTFTGGFTADSFTVEATDASTIDFGDTSNSITCSGDFTADGTGTLDPGNATVSIAGNFDIEDQTVTRVFTGLWEFTGTSKTFNAAGQFLYSITFKAGSSYVVSRSGDVVICRIDGTFTVENTAQITLGTGAARGLYPLESVVISGTVLNGGSSYILHSTNASESVTFNSTADIQVTYYLEIGSDTVNLAAIPTGVMNALLSIRNVGSGNRVLTLASGTYYLDSDLLIQTQSTGTLTLDCSNNPSFELRGDVTVQEATGTVTWSKGTGTITFSGANTQDVDFNDETVEDISVDKSAGTLTFTGGVTTDSMTQEATCAGVVAFGTANITISGDVTVSGTGQFDYGSGATVISGNVTHGSTSYTRLGSGTVSVAGNYSGSQNGNDYNDGSTWTFSGASKTINIYSINAGNFWAVSITGSYQWIPDTGMYSQCFGGLTVSGSCEITQRYVQVSTSLNVNGGTINGSGDLYVYCDVTNTGTIGVNNLYLRCDDAPSDIITLGQGTYAPTNFIPWNNSATPATLRFGAGAFNIDATNFKYWAASTADITIDCSTNNPSINISGNVVRDYDSTGVLDWNKGTNTLTFDGGNTQSVDLDGATVEDISVDKSAGTLTFTDGFTTDSFTVEATNAGNVDFGDTTLSITSSGAVSIDGSGTVDFGDSSWDVGGSWTTTQAATYSAGWAVDLSGSGNIDGGNYNYAFFDLTISGTYETTGSTRTAGDITISGDATITSGLVLDGATKTCTITSAGSVSGTGIFYFPSVAQTLENQGGTYSAPTHFYRSQIVNHTTGTFTFGDTVLFRQVSTNDYDVEIQCDCIFQSSFDFDGDQVSNTFQLRNDLNNPNLEFQSDLTVSTLGATVNWTKGTGTITFSGANTQDVDFNDETVEDISVNKSAGTLTFSGDFTTDSVTIAGSGGAVSFGTANLTCVGNFVWNGPATLAMGSGSHDIGGDWDVYDSSLGTGPVDYGTSTMTFSGSGTINTYYDAFYNIVVSGTYDHNNGDKRSNFTSSLTVQNGGTLTCTTELRGTGNPVSVTVDNGGQIITVLASYGLNLATTTGTITNNGTISASGAGAVYARSSTIINNNIWSAPALFQRNISISGTGTFSGDITWDVDSVGTAMTVSSALTFSGAFAISAGANGTFNNSGNYNLTYQDDVTFSETTGILTYTKGTGTINITGGNDQNLNFAGKAIEDVSVNKSAGIATFTGEVATDLMTVAAGNSIAGKDHAIAHVKSLIVNGTKTNNVIIKGPHFQIEESATVSYAQISESKVINGSITPIYSLSLGGNEGWNFGYAPIRMSNTGSARSFSVNGPQQDILFDINGNTLTISKDVNINAINNFQFYNWNNGNNDMNNGQITVIGDLVLAGDATEDLEINNLDIYATNGGTATYCNVYNSQNISGVNIDASDASNTDAGGTNTGWFFGAVDEAVDYILAFGNQIKTLLLRLRI